MEHVTKLLLMPAILGELKYIPGKMQQPA